MLLVRCLWNRLFSEFWMYSNGVRYCKTDWCCIALSYDLLHELFNWLTKLEILIKITSKYVQWWTFHKLIQRRIYIHMYMHTHMHTRTHTHTRAHTHALEVCTGSKLKPEPGPYPRLSDPTRPDPSGTVKFRARTRPETPPPPPPPTNSQKKKGKRLHFTIACKEID